MERGGTSSGSKGTGKTIITDEEIAEWTRITVNKIKRFNQRGARSGTTVTFHDMTSKGYGWLLPGWVAEERRTSDGRYYYDPDACFYKSQKLAIKAMEQDWNVIVLDT
ncbi:hypothetical protein VNO78_06650 [Psophocarpus tetragonolobus]|uniref:Uncharacterized protein n=1 Tax=Psophocarpus tetragonolobus TaxID=3891 RepID=A0AAN9SUI5_PSOTE